MYKRLNPITPLSTKISDNWWEIAEKTCLVAYQPKGAASLLLSKENVANPGTYDAVAGDNSFPQLTSAGWECISSPPASAICQIPISSIGTVAIRASDWINVASQEILFGAYEPTNRFYIFWDGVNTIRFRRGSTALSVSFSPSDDVYVIAGQEAYLNGTSYGTIPNAGDPAQTGISFNGAKYNGGAPTNETIVTFKAISIYSEYLSPPEVVELTTRMAAI